MQLTLHITDFPLPGYDEPPHIEAIIDYEVAESDYGVSGSPTWDDIENISVVWPLIIEGKSMTEGDFILAYGDQIADRLEGAILAESDRLETWPVN